MTGLIFLYSFLPSSVQWTERHLAESSRRLGESPGTMQTRFRSVQHEKDTATREAVHTRLMMQDVETETTELRHETLNLRAKVDSRERWQSWTRRRLRHLLFASRRPARAV